MTSRISTKHALLNERLGTPPNAELVLSLLSLARDIDRACADMLAPYGLSESRLAAMLAIERRPLITAAELADHLDVTRATVTGLVDGLDRAGYVVRHTPGSDRRRSQLTLSTKGAALLDELMPVYKTWFEALAANVNAETRDVATGALSELHEALESGERS